MQTRSPFLTPRFFNALAKVGLSCINGAALAGAGRIIAVDTMASKLEMAKTFGATDVVNAADGDPVAQIMEMTGGGVHYSFEAIGLKATAEQAFAMLRRGGTATVIGMIPVGVKIELMGAAFLQEKRIQGSFMGSIYIFFLDITISLSNDNFDN